MVGRYTTQGFRNLSLKSPMRVEQLQEQFKPLKDYTAEREKEEALAPARVAEADRVERERMLETAKAAKAIAKAPDKRRVPAPRGKRIKTRARRAAQKLRLTQTSRKRRTRKK